MKKNNRIAVVLINYKDYAKRFLEDCYKSLLLQDLPDFDIYIADNKSTPETRAFLSKLAPKAIIVANEKNLGWAGGNNSIIRPHLDKYDYFIMLNMDTILEESWLRELINHSKTHNVCLVQSKLIKEGTNQINSLGNRINYLGYGFCNAYNEPASTKFDNKKWPTDYLSGASMLVDSNVLKKIGLFREEFFMYHDDLEFCWRAKIAGYELGICEQSVCYHKYSFGSTMNLIYYMERNRLITLLSLESLRSIIFILPMLIPFELSMIVYLGIKGKLSEKLRSLGYVFTPTGIGLIRNIRREVRQYRKLGDKQIVKNFSGKINFSEISNPLLDKIANPVLDIYWNIIRNLI
jgi:GT2 family glycosyltransferase